MTEKRQGVFAAARVAGLSMVYMQGLSLLSGVLIARVVGATDYGIINIARTLVLNAHIVVRLGLDVGLQRYLGEREIGERGSRLADVGLLRRIVLMLSMTVLVALVLGGANWLERDIYQYEGFALVLLGSALALPFLADISVLGGVYRGLLRITPSVLTEYVLMPTVRLAVIVVLFALGWRLWAVVSGTTLAAMVAATVLASLAHRTWAKNSVSTPLVQVHRLQVLRYSLVLSASTVVVYLARSADLLMLGHFRNASQAGQYSVAQMVVGVIALFGNAVGQTTGPRVAALHSQGDWPSLSAMMVRQARWIGMLSIPLCAIMVVWGQSLLGVFGASFRIDARVLALLAVNQYAVALLAPSGWMLSMTGHHRAELWVMLAGLVLMLVAGFVLIPLYGQLGAASAVFATTLIANLARIALGRFRLTVMSMRWQHLWLSLWPVLLAFAAEIVRRQYRGDAGLVEAIGIAILYLLSYACLNWRFGLAPDEQQMLRSRWLAITGRSGH